MRANLLPRPRNMIAILGIEVDSEQVRQATFGFVAIVLVALVGIGIETLRLNRIASAASAAEMSLADRAPEREDAKRLALAVGRYQEIAREEATVRRSGAIAAVAIARIGNAVPPHVWLDSLTHDTNGFELAGGSESVDALSAAILGLGRALPDRPAALATIDNRDPTDGVRFTARISESPRKGADAR
jgi:hypothetical protein